MWMACLLACHLNSTWGREAERNEDPLEAVVGHLARPRKWRPPEVEIEWEEVGQGLASFGAVVVVTGQLTTNL